MKKFLTIILSLLMISGAVLGVSACSDMFLKLPTTNYEKVKFAFNGVEKSLNKKGSSAKKLTLNEQEDNSEKTLTAASFAPPVLLSKDVNSNDISTIYGAMSVERETSDSSFQYDEPPMIQFQYMKALYEEVGEDFSFGTKYTYNLTGEIYYDFSERKATESAEFLTRYSMDVSVKINIDNNDLIGLFQFVDQVMRKFSGSDYNDLHTNNLLIRPSVQPGSAYLPSPVSCPEATS